MSWHCELHLVLILIGLSSLFQEDSWEPLQIDQHGLEGIIRLHGLAPEFLSTLSAAGQPPLDSEEGFGHPIERNEEEELGKFLS